MLLSYSLILFSTALAFRGAYAAVYTDPAQLPDRQYDYVVVGGASVQCFTTGRGL